MFSVYPAEHQAPDNCISMFQGFKVEISPFAMAPTIQDPIRDRLLSIVFM